MPTFPSGSRAWICDSNKVPFPEYGESSEVIEEPDGSKTHISTVYIASQKGQEFQAGYNLMQEGHLAHVFIKIEVDGSEVDKFSVTHFGVDRFCKGWRDAYTLQYMTFGAIDVEESDEAEMGDKAKQLLSSCIEISFYGAVITSRAAPRPLAGMPQVAAPVHPDSKAAQLVGVQVKPGQKVINHVPAMTCGYALGKAPNATKYVARIFYRPENILIAQSIMPDPNAGKRKAKTHSPVSDDGFEVKEAGPSKRKVKAKLEPDGVKKEGQSSQSAIDVDAAPKNQKVFMDLTGGGDSDDDD